MDDVFETVDGGDLAIASFVGAAGYGDFVVFADGDGADLGERGVLATADGHKRILRHTLYFSRSSLLSGALIMTRRTEEGAWK